VRIDLWSDSKSIMPNFSRPTNQTRQFAPAISSLIVPCAILSSHDKNPNDTSSVRRIAIFAPSRVVRRLFSYRRFRPLVADRMGCDSWAWISVGDDFFLAQAWRSSAFDRNLFRRCRWDSPRSIFSREFTFGHSRREAGEHYRALLLFWRDFNLNLFENCFRIERRASDRWPP
jgi:hypothetical protein